jgi:DNA-binding beta-propeller fold protein YncE
MPTIYSYEWLAFRIKKVIFTKKHFRLKIVFNYISLTVVLLILVSEFPYAQPGKTDLVWPPTPQKARIKFVQTISSLKDVSSEPGFLSRIFGWLFGSEEATRWLVQPVAVAVSKDGELYISDPGAKCIHVLDLKNKKHHFISETKYGNLISPVGLAFSLDKKIFISDSERGEVIVLDEYGDALFRIKNRLVRPTGITIAAGKLYVIDTAQHKILVFDLNGNFLFEFGRRGSGQGEFNYPVHLTAFGSNLYGVDAMNYRIQIFDLDGKFISTFGDVGNAAGTFAHPKSASIDSDGNIYVTDALMDVFQIFNKDGKLLLVVGSKGIADGEFMSPSGITVDSSDNIYVADALNRRIQIFRYLK